MPNESARTSELMDKILIGDDKRFGLFCEALVDSGQEHIVKQYLTKQPQQCVDDSDGTCTPKDETDFEVDKSANSKTSPSGKGDEDPKSSGDDCDKKPPPADKDEKPPPDDDDLKKTLPNCIRLNINNRWNDVIELMNSDIETSALIPNMENLGVFTKVQFKKLKVNNIFVFVY